MTCTRTYIHGAMNPELEKKKEFERRKKLRLLQVRQQSKEFTDKLRERIKEEIIQQNKKYVECEKKLREEKHLQELQQLKEFYDRCLQSIGEGHKEAAKQPNFNVEKQAELARNSARANKRGTKAVKKQLEDEASLKQKIELPVKQKKAIRNKENLRAFYVSSLPKHGGYLGPRPVPPQNYSSHQNKEPQKTRQVLEEIPCNLTGCESKLPGVQHYLLRPEKEDVLKKDSKVEGKICSRKNVPSELAVTVHKPKDSLSNSSSPRECSCDYIVCSCHKSPTELRRCSSESRISSGKGSDLEELRKKKVRSRSCSPQSVRTLNYLDCGNVYESNQQSCVRVTQHSNSPKKTEEEPLSNTVQEVHISKPSNQELKKRTDERSAKALRKEKLKQDFQQLIQNLKRITQEKSVISSKTKGKLRVFSSERVIQTRNEAKQKKLNAAFERLPHGVKNSKTQDSGKPKPNYYSIDDSSPPTLNLAIYQTNMPSPHSSRDHRVMTTDGISESELKSSARSESPKVLVNRDPSGDVHITVKVSEVLGGRSRSPDSYRRSRSRDSHRSLRSPKSHQKSTLPVSPGRSRSPLPASPERSRSPLPASPGISRSPDSPGSGSSYLSPPKNLTPSQQQLLDALLNQVNKRAVSEEMTKYIQKLLHMSRESIDDLRGLNSPNRTKSPQLTSTRSPQSPVTDVDIERDLIKLGELAEVYADKVNTLVCMYEQMSPPSSGDYIDPIRGPRRSTPPSSDPTPTQRNQMPTPSPRPRQIVCPPAPPVNVGPSGTPCPPPGQMSRRTPSPGSSGSNSSDETMELIFGGIPGVPVPSKAELEARLRKRPQRPQPPSSPVPDDVDLFEDFERRRRKIRQEISGPSCKPDCGGSGDESDSAFGGSCARGQEPWGDMNIGDGDFGAEMNTILQEACEEDCVDYPDDFSPSTDIFGWDINNLDQLNFPSSLPGYSTLDIDAKLDTSFDTSAFQFPLNPEKLNAITQKLANIFNNQYCEMIEELQKNAITD